MSGIFGVGIVVMDQVVQLPRYPPRDSKSIALHSWQQVGGPVPVALSTAAFYGARTTFCGRWGSDHVGDDIARTLRRRKIQLAVSESATDWTSGVSQVWTEEAHGTRTIAYVPGKFPQLTAADMEEHLDLIVSCQLLHLDGSSPDAAIRAASLVSDQRGIVVLDAGSKKPGMETLLPSVDVLIASDLFCESWFGDAAVPLQELAALGASMVVRTSGADGATLYDGQTTVHRPALNVRAIDTNGAGDVFAGAFSYGLAAGWQPTETLGFANAVAGYACSQRGNSSWAPMPEVKRLIANAS